MCEKHLQNVALFFPRMLRQPYVSPRSFPHTVLTTPVLLTKCLSIEASGNVEETIEIQALRKAHRTGLEYRHAGIKSCLELFST